MCKGSLSLDGNQTLSVKAKESLTVRPTSRAGAKAGLSDPTVPCGRAVAQRTKVTLGINVSPILEKSKKQQNRVKCKERLHNILMLLSQFAAKLTPKSKNVQRLGIKIPTKTRQLKKSFPSCSYKLGDCKVTVM